MAATPILTQILQEDCIRICTSQISEKILLSVSEKIGLNPQLPQPTGAQNSAGATKSSVLINVGIAVAITFTLVVGGLLGRAVWREYIAPEPTPIVEQTEEIDDIIIALKKVQNKSEFEVFKVTYGFDASETVLHEDGMYQLYIGIRDGKQFRAGFLETESGAIATTYEIASLEAETPKNVREWFLANSS